MENETCHRIAVLADTHDLLRPKVTEILRTCEIILHGGDLSSPKILEELERIAPVYAVRGNNDKEWAERLPHSLTFTIEGVRFFMLHNKRDVPADLSDVDVVVYGHSHKYACETRDSVLWLNPGSCGRRRFDQEITFAVMTAEDGQFQVEKVTISHEQK